MQSEPLGDPQGMRPAQQRFWNGYIGEYALANGRTVWAVWVPCSQTDAHIVIWDDKSILETVENINRLQAARETERLLEQLES